MYVVGHSPKCKQVVSKHFLCCRLFSYVHFLLRCVVVVVVRCGGSSWLPQAPSIWVQLCEIKLSFLFFALGGIFFFHLFFLLVFYFFFLAIVDLVVFWIVLYGIESSIIFFIVIYICPCIFFYHWDLTRVSPSFSSSGIWLFGVLENFCFGCGIFFRLHKHLSYLPLRCFCVWRVAKSYRTRNAIEKRKKKKSPTVTVVVRYMNHA